MTIRELIEKLQKCDWLDQEVTFIVHGHKSTLLDIQQKREMVYGTPSNKSTFILITRG